MSLTRKRIHKIFEPGSTHNAASDTVSIFIIICILISTLEVILSTVESISNRFRLVFVIVEAVIVVIFTVEYALRVWSSVEARDRAGDSALRARLKYCLSPFALVDLIAILPFYLALIVPLDASFLRAARILRLLKLANYFPSLGLLLTVVKKQSHSMMSVVGVLILLLLLASAGIYAFEHKVQPDVFSSIPASMWWAVTTLTTVGYGDVVPITTGGRIFASAVALIGIGVVALPAGLLASGFSEEMALRQHVLRREVSSAALDGIIDDDENRTLEAKAVELGIDPARLADTIAEFGPQPPIAADKCPHCGSDLHG